MDRERWQRLSVLLDEGLALDAGVRGAWLDALRQDDAELAGELAKMLESASEPTQATLGAFDPYLAPALTTSSPTNRVTLQGKRLGAWRLEAKIGQGGMGEVWRASRADGLYDAQAAIKLLRTDLSATRLAARFARERAVLARLSHPAIARLLDAGEHDGQPYLVLELVAGHTLSEHVREKVPTVAGRVRLLLQIAQAVEHAHAQLIIHRDLKPSNVLVTDGGEPKLLDFGIAGLMDDASATGDGELTRQVGRGLTLAYAAPEQLTGAPIGTAADQFALGVMLYQLLCGELPFGHGRVGRGAAEQALLHGTQAPFREAVQRSRAEASAAPSTGAVSADELGPGCPVDAARAEGDLEAVVARALRKAPAERYGSLREFTQDLERWLGRHPVSVRREHWRHNTWLWLQRHALLTAALSGVILALGGGLAAATWQWQAAQEARHQSEAVTRYLTDMLAEASPDRHRGQWPTVLELLDRSREQLDQRFADAPEAKLQVMQTLITTYRHLNRFDLSMPLAEKWVALAEKEYGANDPRTLQARIEQARGYQIQGLFDKSLAAGEPIVDAVRRGFGAESPELRNLLYILNACYTRTGRLDDADRTLAEAGRLLALTYPPDHPAHGSHLNHIQVLRNGQGRLRDALAAMKQTERWWANPPQDYLREVLVWRRNTLAIQIRLAEYEGVEARIQALLQDMDRLMGRGNDMAQGLRNELARYYTESGQPAKAYAQREANIGYAREGAVQHVALLVPLRAQRLLAAAQAQQLDSAALRRDARALLDETAANAPAIGFPRSDVYLAVARAALALDDSPIAGEALARMASDTGLRLDRDRLLAARKLQLDGQLARLRGDLAESRRLLQQRRDSFDSAAERRVVPGWSAALDLAYTLVLAQDPQARAALDDAKTRRPPKVADGHPLDAVTRYLDARLRHGNAQHPEALQAMAELASRQGRPPGSASEPGLGSLRGAIF